MNVTYEELMFVLRHSPDDQQVLLDITWSPYPAIQYIIYSRPQQPVYEVALRVGQRREIDRRHFECVDEFSSWLKDIMVAVNIHHGKATLDLLPIAPFIKIQLT